MLVGSKVGCGCDVPDCLVDAARGAIRSRVTNPTLSRSQNPIAQGSPVHDGHAPMRETHPSVWRDPHALAIRPTMTHSRQGRRLDVAALRSEVQDSNDAAHRWLFVSSVRSRPASRHCAARPVRPSGAGAAEPPVVRARRPRPRRSRQGRCRSDDWLPTV